MGIDIGVILGLSNSDIPEFRNFFKDNFEAEHRMRVIAVLSGRFISGRSDSDEETGLLRDKNFSKFLSKFFKNFVSC